MERQFDRPGNILDVGEVAALAAIPVNRHRLSCHHPEAKRFQGKIGPLSWPPDRKEPKCQKAYAVELGIESPPLLTLKLGQSVGTARIWRGRFLGRQWRVRSIDAGRRGEDEMRGAHLAAVIQEADGADDVSELVAEWIVERGANTSQRGKVDYHVEGLLGEQPLTDVAIVEFDALGQCLLGRHLVERRHLVSRLMEMPNDIGADEAGRTGDENGERFEIHALRLESTAPHQGNQAADVIRCQFVWPESHHTPTGQRRFEVFLQVGGESRAAVVATVHVDAALDFDQGF